MRRIAPGRADEALEQLRGADGGDLAAAIHGARKDLKKLRAVVRLVRDPSWAGRLAKGGKPALPRRAGGRSRAARDAEVEAGDAGGTATPARASRLPHADCERWADRSWSAERDELAPRSAGDAAGEVAEAIAALEAGRDRDRRVDAERRLLDAAGAGPLEELPRWTSGDEEGSRDAVVRRTSTSGGNGPRICAISCGSSKRPGQRPLGATDRPDARADRPARQPPRPSGPA